MGRQLCCYWLCCGEPGASAATSCTPCVGISTGSLRAGRAMTPGNACGNRLFQSSHGARVGSPARLRATSLSAEQRPEALWRAAAAGPVSAELARDLALFASAADFRSMTKTF